MPETKKAVHPVKVSYACDECKDGEMQATGHVKPPAAKDDPALFLHKCGKCGHTADLPKQYPHVDFADEPLAANRAQRFADEPLAANRAQRRAAGNK